MPLLYVCLFPNRGLLWKLEHSYITSPQRQSKPVLFNIIHNITNVMHLVKQEETATETFSLLACRVDKTVDLLTSLSQNGRYT
jgi:hypothetical protein